MTSQEKLIKTKKNKCFKICTLLCKTMIELDSLLRMVALWFLTCMESPQNAG